MTNSFFLIYKKTKPGLNFDSANYVLFEDCELFAIYLIIRYAAFMFVNCQRKTGLHGTPTIFMVVINCFVQLSK